MTTCTEIYIYNVKATEEGEAARREAMRVIAAYAGFRTWRPLKAASGEAVFGDILEWDTVASADAATERFMSDPKTERFRAAFGETIAMARMVEATQAETVV